MLPIKVRILVEIISRPRPNQIIFETPKRPCLIKNRGVRGQVDTCLSCRRVLSSRVKETTRIRRYVIKNYQQRRLLDSPKDVILEMVGANAMETLLSTKRKMAKRVRYPIH